MRFYWPIAKFDAERRMVWGYASTEAADSDGETVRREALAAALDDYMRFANIREMHQPSAVGVAEEAAIDDKGLYLAARIVDAEAWEKVVAGVYKGFSIGGRVTARDPANRNIITGLSLTEISVVDRPANPEAVFDCWKRAAPASEDIEYADPGYQQDGNKRYPIDTEEHIRAACAYIHVPDNRRHYTAAQLAHIEARIAAAWHDRIDPAGPPAAAADKSEASSDVIRGLDPRISEMAGSSPTMTHWRLIMPPPGGRGRWRSAPAAARSRRPAPPPDIGRAMSSPSRSCPAASSARSRCRRASATPRRYGCARGSAGTPARCRPGRCRVARPHSRRCR
jgi:phage head maturation protease